NFYPLLDQRDIDLQKEDLRRGPVMEAGKNETYWSTNNQWQCFPNEKIELRCATYDLDTKVPSIVITQPFHRYEFDLPFGESPSCEETLQHWDFLINSSNQICIYAAFFPAIDAPGYGAEWSLWYIENIKTHNGY